MSRPGSGKFDFSSGKRELLQRLRPREGAGAAGTERIPRRTGDGQCPLSFAQQRLWFLDQLDPGSPAYNLPSAQRLQGELDQEALRQSFDGIVARHEALRTRFPTLEGRPVQHIEAPGPVPLPLVDLSHLPEAARMAEARRLAAAEAVRAFDLAEGPLLRATLLRLADEEHVLLLTMHHIVSDGWSRGIFTRELAAFYEAFRSGSAPSLGELPIQYADFATWQRGWLDGEVLDKRLDYWRRRLDGLGPLVLPTDRAREAVQSWHGAMVPFRLSEELLEGLKELGQEQEATPFMVLLAAFQALLHRQTGQDDIAVGSAIANRGRAELEGLIGFFVNTLVLRTDLSGNPTFRELVTRVKEVALGAYEHQDLPFERLVDEVGAQRDLGRNPIFQVAFALQVGQAEPEELSGLKLQPFGMELTTTRFDLELHVREGAGGAVGVLVYNTALFDAPTVERMAGHFQTLLEGLVAGPDTRLSELPILTDRERHQLLAEWCDTGRPREGRELVHELVETAADRAPGALAVACGDARLTYGDLDRRSNQLARRLRKLGVGADVPVGLCVERSVDLVLGSLGVLKAGGAYLPLDPSYPKAQLGYVLGDAAVPVLLTQRHLLDRLPSLSATVLCLDGDWDAIAVESDARLSTVLSPENLAYVIYTSGSTGRPKGVEIPHRGLLNLVRWHQRVYEVEATDRATQLAGPAFDASVWEVWPYLAAGASLHIPDEDTRRSPGRLKSWLATHGITLSFLPTPLAELLLKEEGLEEVGLRALLTGGDRLHARSGAALPFRLLNHYGPTECSVVATSAAVDRTERTDPPIGRAIDNTKVHVLDRHLNLVPVGVPGELFIGGESVARGYLKRPDLTADRFVPDPFGALGGGRLYRTGDLVKYRADGNLEFLGRVDHQVKIRGFRVEPGEIESVLGLHPAVREAAVLVREGNTPSDKRLVAYVVPVSGRDKVAGEGGGASDERIAQWQQVYDSVVYDEVTAQPVFDPTFNISGWNSTYTGKPISEEEMREQVDHTVARLLAGRPRRVLEIGCGTGLLLFRAAPQCEHYVGTDFSAAAVGYIRERLDASPASTTKVELLIRRADDFTGIMPGSFDAVVLNSVVQYFPDAQYLRSVLEGALRALAPKGRLFVGDVRYLPLLETYAASVQLHQAIPGFSKAQLRERTREQVLQDQELVVHPGFFEAFAGGVPGVARVHVSPKRGRFRNEFTKYRYDAILEMGPAPAELEPPLWMDWEENAFSLPQLHRLLVAEAPAAFGVRRVPNARTRVDALAAHWLARGDDGPREADDGAGVDPEDLWALSEELPYAVDLSWANTYPEGSYDVLFRRRPGAGTSLPVFGTATSPLRAWSDYTNDPLRATRLRGLVAQLRRFVQERLPEHMVPSAFVFLDTLPLSPNGKVDQRALLALEMSGPEMGEAFEGPRTPVEEALARIWERVLGLPRVGIHDNFFELGGDSILSIQIVARANEAGLRLTPKQMFQHQTVAELAGATGTEAVVEAEQDLITGTVPLTPIQRWFFEQELEDAHHFNQAVMLEIREPLTAAAVAEAVRAIEAHHDALRLRFSRRGAVWLQETAGPADGAFLHVDLRAVPDGDESRAVAERAAELQASLNLGQGPLWRVALFDLGVGRPSRLLVVVHHLAVDGVSWRVLLDDLGRACTQARSGEGVRLPPKTTSFRRWAERLVEYAGSEAARAELAHWRSACTAGSLPLPIDEPAGVNTVGEAGRVSVALGPDETRALLQEAPAAYGTQVDEVLLTALARAVTRWTGGSTLLLDLEGHGREELFEGVDVSRTVGWFTSMSPLRLEVPAGAGPGEALKSVKEQVRAIPRRGVGYGVLRYLGGAVADDLRAHPDAELSFNYLGQFDNVLGGPGLFAAAVEGAGPLRSRKGRRPHLLEVNAMVAGGRLSVTWTHGGRVHLRSTIERLAATFVEELRALIAHCRSREARGYTPSDFPLARLDQPTLDRLLGAGEGVEDVYPLSPMQEGLLFHSLLDPTSGVYFEQVTVDLRGAFDTQALARAWQCVVDRHPILRTRFAWEDLPRPLQVVQRTVPLEFIEEDWRALPPSEHEMRLAAVLAADRSRPFDLSRTPLLRVVGLRTGADRYRLACSFHHILLDGWSVPLLFKELVACYEALARGQEPALAPVPPYSSYIGWLQEQDLAGAERYWRRTLAGFRNPTPLPLDLAPSRGYGTVGEMSDQFLHLSASASSALKKLGREHQITLNTFVQSAWGLLLSRFSGESDVVFGSNVSGRPPTLKGVESMVGLFINTLPLRIRVEDDAPLLSWLKSQQALQVEQRLYEFSPLVEVQAWGDAPAGRPLFESIIAFENYPVDPAGRGLETVTGGQYQGRTNYPLSMTAGPGARLWARLSYDKRRFTEEAVQRLLACLGNLLEGMATRPDQPVGSLPLLAADERHRVLVEWNATEAAVPPRLVHELFEEQADRTPDALALADSRQRLTYRELDRRANHVAHRLRQVGVGPESRVGILVDRSVEMVVGLLGILKAGGAYVPFDPISPAERLAFMRGDSGVSVVLTQEDLLSTLPASPARLVCLDGDRKTVAEHSEERLPRAAGLDNLAYVIYTSGSTGRPKGVEVEHRGLSNLVQWHRRVYEVEPRDRATQLAGPAFDASVWELWPYLAAGASIHIPDEQTRLSPRALRSWLAREAITLTFLPTPLAEGLLREEGLAELSLKALLTGGDKLHRVSGVSLPFRVVNHYGPTESSVVATCGEVVVGAESDPPIGRPIDNTRAYVLDLWGQPLPIGMPGELYLGGDGLARGYLGRSDLTAERFVPDPFSSEPGRRLYRTGDVVRHRADGSLEFLGRMDAQVKIRGFRIELGEIEAALAEHAQVKDAVAVVREDHAGGKGLVAYVTARGGQPVEPIGLRQYLKSKLPEYMVPSAFVVLEALPLSPNGKVDRRALPAPVGEGLSAAAHVAPTSDLETLVAGIWQEVLGVPRVGIHDNFFDRGGHSLLIIQVHRRILAALPKCELPVVALFEHPTIASLAARLAEGAEGASPARPDDRPVETPEQGREKLREARLRLARRREVASEREAEGGGDA